MKVIKCGVMFDTEESLTLTDIELRALEVLLSNSINCCSSGCAFEEMQDNKIDCNECIFTKTINSLEDKIGMYS
jgi:DNA-binding response OmpR family regulator